MLRAAKAWSPLFLDAAWELCRRGIVRPGVRSSGAQAVGDGGYSVVTEWRERLADLDDTDLVLMQPGSLAAALASFSNIFGEGFHQRTQEAVKCRTAEAWLACCAMVGAAAESILLAVAIAKIQNEGTVLSAYGSARGRSKVLDMITANIPAGPKRELEQFSGIISLWRDEAAHGRASDLDTANADEALRELLHMCQWTKKNWAKLT